MNPTINSVSITATSSSILSSSNYISFIAPTGTMLATSIVASAVNPIIPCPAPSFSINAPSVSTTTHYLSLTNTEIPFTAVTPTKDNSLQCSDITISYTAVL